MNTIKSWFNRRTNHRDFEEKYQLKDVIGEGDFGAIQQCRKYSNREKFTVKIISRRLIRPDDWDALRPRQLREISAMKALCHKNIINLVKVYESTDSFKLLMGFFASSTNLTNFLHDKPAKNELLGASIFGQIVSGVHFMHKKGWAHLDIRPDNILITNKKCLRSLQVKLMDFGLSQRMDTPLLNQASGKPLFMAPEMFIKDTVYFGGPVDIWALGVTLFIMMVGCHPFEDGEWGSTQSKPLPSTLSVDLRHLTKKMLRKDTETRLKIQVIRDGYWLACAKMRLEEIDLLTK